MGCLINNQFGYQASGPPPYQASFPSVFVRYPLILLTGLQFSNKVATAAAGRKPTKEEAEAASTTECKNQECDFVFEGKVKKFCPKCGTNQL